MHRLSIKPSFLNEMTTDHTAIPHLLGYIYQLEVALYLILQKDEGMNLSIEHIDDVVFHSEEGDPIDRLQIKHHKHLGNLTDASPDIWKTIKVWCDDSKFEDLIKSEITLTILTTETAKEGSIAYMLRPDSKSDPNIIVKSLDKVAKESTNKTLAKSFDAYLKLSDVQKKLLIQKFVVLDKSSLIQNIGDKTKNLLNGIRPRFREAALRRIRGWWFELSYAHLVQDNPKDELTLISKSTVSNQIANISDQFKEDVLPLDFRSKEPEIPDDANSRLFVSQLELIGLTTKLIEQAILDYYRAYWQRSYWIRDDLLDTFGELDDYEGRLIEEWEIFSEKYKLLLGKESSEEELIECGRKLYFSILDKHIPIRSGISDPYFMRGNYHILSDNQLEQPPRIGWHPEFVSKLEEIFVW